MSSDPIKFESFSIGVERRANQDSVFGVLVDSGFGVFAIADGVGGSGNGQLSSQLAIEAVKEWVASGCFDLTRLFDFADQKIKQRLVAEGGKYTSLSTTLTVCLVDDNILRFAHVGDCRIYLLRGSGLKTLTRDQTEVQYLIDQGVLPKSRARSYARSHVLLSAIGSSTPYELQKGEFRLEPGDRVVLCSDGFYNSVKKRQIASLSSIHALLEDFASALHELAADSKIQDDCTAFVLEM